MKINDVLECFNKALTVDRENQNRENKGHFVAYSNIRKSMGPYREFFTQIVYVNPVTTETKYICNNKLMERCCKDEESIKLETNEKKALEKFIYLMQQPEVWNKVIQGKYGD